MQRPDSARSIAPDADVIRHQTLSLPPEAVSARRARSWVSDQLPDIGEDTRDTLRLLTSELVTNAVVHARTPLQVSLSLTRTDVLVEVFDLDLDLGHVAAGMPDRDGGRGLTLVEHLASSHGRVQHPGGGKTYWFRLALAVEPSSLRT